MAVLFLTVRSCELGSDRGKLSLHVLRAVVCHDFRSVTALLEEKKRLSSS